MYIIAKLRELEDDATCGRDDFRVGGERKSVLMPSGTDRDERSVGVCTGRVPPERKVPKAETRQTVKGFKHEAPNEAAVAFAIHLLFITSSVVSPLRILTII